VTVLAATALLPLTLTACGSNRSPQTYEERPTVDAAQASMGDLELRNITVKPPRGEEYAVGEEATATLSIVNMGEAGDRLIGATSSAATSVELVDDTGAVQDRLEIPPLGAVGSGDFSLRLKGLTKAIRPGQHLELSLAFTRAGRRTLSVPVAVYAEPAPRPSTNPFEEGEEGAEPETESDGAEGVTEG
jgi:copper(I)-binding protein